MGPRDGRREEVRVSRSREAPASKIYKVRTDGQISKDQSSGEKKKPSYRVNSFKIQSKVCATYGVIESMDLYSLGLKELASRLFWPA